jgi:peroxiredoxin
MRGLAVSFLLLLGAAIARAQAPAPRGPGDLVLPLVLQDVAGGTHDLAAAIAKGPVVLFFWSVYCPNCKEAMPGLVALHGKWGGRGLTVWAINVDGDRFSNAVRAYVDEMALPFPALYDRLEGEYLVAADPLGVSKTPTIFLIDGEGRIVLRQTVDVDYDALATSVASQLR